MNAPVENMQGGTALQNVNQTQLILDPESMRSMTDLAKFMAEGTLTLPEPYRRNPANCLAVVMQAVQWKMSPFAVAQKTHFVNGQIGYEAQLVSAVINASGAIMGQFKFEWFVEWDRIVGKFEERESKTKKDDNGYPKKYKVPGWNLEDEKGLGIKVSAVLKGETEPRELTLLMTQANVRNSPLWADDPKQQIAYLAQKRWARLYAPGVILGVYTPDEAEEFGPKEVDVTSAGSHEIKKDYYSKEEFEANKPAWKKSVQNGKEPERFIAFIESKGKLFSEDMKAEITTWKKAEPATTGDAGQPANGPATIEGESTKVDDDFVAGIEAEESAQK
jgi:hypothetical protein